MNPNLTVIRSIGAEFAKRLFYPIAIVSSIIFTLLVVGVIYLGTLSEWWLLLLIPVVILLCIAFAVLAVMWLTIRTVTPIQTKVQRRATKKFVDKLQRLSETIHTPKIVLLFRIVRDIAAPRQNGFIGSIADDTASLRQDFRELQKLFQ